jgi:uroporphyrinogen-III synthase
MRILVTRPKEDADRTAVKLRARGHTVLVAPLIEIRFADGPEISLDGVQAILATSSNGVQALARRTRRRDVPLFAVGAQTARAARDTGFAAVKSANGDARALVAAAVDWAKPDAGALLHAAGAETRGQLAGTLRAHGFEVRTSVVYDAIAVSGFPTEALTALKSGELDVVLLFSPRSARIFCECAIKAGVADRCAALMAVCISQAASDDLAPLGLRVVHVASGPNEEAVLALLE